MDPFRLDPVESGVLGGQLAKTPIFSSLFRQDVQGVGLGAVVGVGDGVGVVGVGDGVVLGLDVGVAPEVCVL